MDCPNRRGAVCALWYAEQWDKYWKYAKHPCKICAHPLTTLRLTLSDYSGTIQCVRFFPSQIFTMSETVVTEVKGLSLNSLIANSLIVSVENCLQMCDLKVRVVGVSKIPIQLPEAPITGLIGLSGKCTGFISLSMPERVATLAVSGLLMEEHKALNAQVVDGVGEMTNVIAGGVKTKLSNTPWMIGSITIPSVIIGSHYNIAYSKGIEYCGITFEVDDPDTLSIQGRVFSVDTSLIQATS